MASNYDEYDCALKSGELLNNGRFEIIEKMVASGSFTALMTIRIGEKSKS